MSSCIPDCSSSQGAAQAIGAGARVQIGDLSTLAFVSDEYTPATIAASLALSRIPSSKPVVFIDGLRIRPSTYSVNGQNLMLTVQAGQSVVVDYWGLS